MLSTRWRKVVRELWANRTRTLLVVSSIAVGIFAVGTVQHLRTVILSEMQAIYVRSNAEHATIFMSGADEALLDAIRREPDVATAEGRSSVSVKVEVAPGEWESLSLSAADDFATAEINRIEPLYSFEALPDFGAARTDWPADDEVLLERSSLKAAGVLPEGVRVGDTLRIETPDGRYRTLTVSGAAYDANAFPANFTGTGSGYVTRDTIAALGGSRTYSRVLLRVDGTPAQLRDEEYITQVAERVREKVERGGYTVQRVQVPTPGEIPLQDLFDSLALLLTPLGVLALALSSFLVINTISALMAQQVRQIGVMKAIGARREQIIVLYLGAVLLYSVGALLVAVPLTVLVGGAIAVFLGGFINIDFPQWALPPNVLILEVVVGVLVPLLAAIYPVMKGTSVTVREAISDYGTSSTDVQEGWLTRVLASLQGLSRPLRLSMRNTFRRKGRLALTLITLTLGGMLFMTVGSVRASLDELINTGLEYYQFDIQIQMDQPYRTAQIEQVARRMPELGLIESWDSSQAVRVRADGSEGDPLTLTALPAESQMVQPTLIAGRWLLPEDQNALVISQNVLGAEPDLGVGDTMTLEIGDKQSKWVIVGVAQVLGGPPNVVPIYANAPYYARVANSVGRATSLQAKLAPGATVTQDEAVAELNERLEAAGYGVASTFTIATLRRFTGSFFDIIVYLLLTMGVLIAAVGALGLMGTMSTNVLERTREIGVMRAIGASDWDVQQVVLVEGVFIGWISWIFGALLAFPTGALLATTVGVVLFQAELPYTFSSGGLLTWFIIVTILAAVASFLPAWNASRLTVREVLAYQ